jgi:hypothetical protein
MTAERPEFWRTRRTEKCTESAEQLQAPRYQAIELLWSDEFKDVEELRCIIDQRTKDT